MDYYVNLTMYKQACVNTDLTFCQGDYGQTLVLQGISDSRSAKIVFRKPDGKTVEYASLTKNGDVYTHTLQVAELQAIGTVTADVKFYDTSSRESSQKFTFTVKADTINDSVRSSIAYSDSIEAAKTAFNALISAMETAIQNNTAQKITNANTQLQTYIDSITEAAVAATTACNNVVADKVGISNDASTTTAYSGAYTQGLIDAVTAIANNRCYPKPGVDISKLPSSDVDSCRDAIIVGITYSNSQTMTNLPVQYAGMLKITPSGAYCLQEYDTLDHHYRRWFNSSTWTTWKTVF